MLSEPAISANQPTSPIYKVCPQSVWESIRNMEEWTGSEHDQQDGFIHFSAAHQLAGTVARHFSGQANLMLIAIDPDRLGAQLRWEPSRGGDLFPHLYAALPLSAVIEARALIVSENGSIPGVG